MKIPRDLLIILFLSSCTSAVLASNPDSVRVQGESDDDGNDNKEAPAPLQSSTSSPQNNTRKPSRLRTLWNKVVPFGVITSSIETVRRFGPLSTFVSRKYEIRKTRPDFVVPTDEIGEETVTSRPSGASSGKESAPKFSGLDTKPEDIILTPRRPSDFENEQEDSSSSNNHDFKRPTEEEILSNGDISSRNGLRRNNYNPISFDPSSPSGQGTRESSDSLPGTFNPQLFNEKSTERPSDGHPATFNPFSSEEDAEITTDDRRAAFDPSLAIGKDSEVSPDNRPAAFDPSLTKGKDSEVSADHRPTTFDPSLTRRKDSEVSPDHPPAGFDPSLTKGKDSEVSPDHRPTTFDPSLTRRKDSDVSPDHRPAAFDPSLTKGKDSEVSADHRPTTFDPTLTRRKDSEVSPDHRPAAFDPSLTRRKDSEVAPDNRPTTFDPSLTSRTDSEVSPDHRPAEFDPSLSSGKDSGEPSGDHPAGFKPSFSSEKGAAGTTDDHPTFFGSSSLDEKGAEQPLGDRPALFNPSLPNDYNGRRAPNDRPLAFKPSSSDETSPNTSLNPQDSKVESSSDGDSVETRSPPTPEDVPVTARRRMPQDSTSLIAGIINDFTFKLVDILERDKNFVVSPLSIFAALSMCYLGSEGRTKTELEETLGLNAKNVRGVQLHHGMRELASQVLSRSREFDIRFANGMFLGQNFTVNRSFLDEIQAFYDTELKQVNFERPEQSVPVINDWVKRATQNMITSLGDVPPSAATRLLLISAVYFKGMWKTQFPENMTYDGRFTSYDGETRSVPIMPLYGETFPFFKSDQQRHSFIKLPYEGEQVSMIIALPYAPQEKPMPTITDEILYNVRNVLVRTRMDTVALPRFRLEYTKSLRRPLANMGMSSLFDPNTKDLSRMRKENDIYVSSVLHKAVIEVNERGTKASAVTSVSFVPLSFRNTTDFVANHPFAFYVVHEPTGLVLFYGKIYSLEGKSDVAPNNRRQTPSDRRQSNRNRPSSYDRRQANRNRPSPSNRRNRTEAPSKSRVRNPGAVTYEDSNK